MKTKFQRISQFLFFFIILFVRLPNFYLLPVTSSLFLSNNILRVIVLALLAVYIYVASKEKLPKLIDKKTAVTIGLYLVSQSLSIVQTQDIPAFLTVYKDVVFGIALYFLASLILNQKNIGKYTAFLRWVILGTLVVQILIFTFPDFRTFIFSLLNDSYLTFFKYQFDRGRYFGDTLEEAFFPILLLGVFTQTATNGVTRAGGLLASAMAFYVAYISNWRTKFLICITSFLASLYLYRKSMLFFIPIFVVLIGGVSLVMNKISLQSINQSVIDRLLSDDIDERQINKSRLDYLYSAVSIGSSHLFTGAGLGNYYDLLSATEKKNNRALNANSSSTFILIDDPHNIFFSTFATSGLVGLIALISLLFFFAKQDIHTLLSKNADHYAKAYVCVFWSIFIYACLNPWLYFSYLCNFWLMRAFADSSQKKFL